MQLYQNTNFVNDIAKTTEVITFFYIKKRNKCHIHTRWETNNILKLKRHFFFVNNDVSPQTFILHSVIERCCSVFICLITSIIFLFEEVILAEARTPKWGQAHWGIYKQIHCWTHFITSSRGETDSWIVCAFSYN